MERQFDIVIIGGGPAGLSAAIYAARAGMSVAILENYAPGGKLVKTAHIENYPGISSTEGTTLAMSMFEHAQKYGCEYIPTGALSVSADKTVTCEDGTVLKAKAVIMASGTVERKLNIPNEEENIGRGISFCAICDGAFFKNKPIVVVGGGNSALEEAIYLTQFGSKVTILVRNELRADENIREEAYNNEKIEIIKKRVPLNVVDDGNKVVGIKVRNVENQEEYIEECSAIFPYIGNDPISSYASDLNICDEFGYILTDEEMATAIPGIFAAGDIRKKTIRQVVTAASDGAIAAQSAFHYIQKNR